jgi:hypothetical protein
MHRSNLTLKSRFELLINILKKQNKTKMKVFFKEIIKGNERERERERDVCVCVFLLKM